MKNLCTLRDIYHALAEVESVFHKKHNLCLNEAMIICSLKEGRMASGEIAGLLNLTCSNTSKLLRSVEEKGFVERDLGEKDKRQMYFSLTKAGVQKLISLEVENLELPEILSKLIKEN
ncbi:MAG: winged helix DNA-binding protein [Bacteroidales bacterium]|nr:winged helix DNA-binding protein [Bacteroidales bacterium]MDD3989967.1 winged helix DNA-binding protein [Bacteroidales bacterium]MDD4638527.1 winged helix DNA-binding protein [Bacteroidales bacterium]